MPQIECTVGGKDTVVVRPDELAHTTELLGLHADQQDTSLTHAYTLFLQVLKSASTAQEPICREVVEQNMFELLDYCDAARGYIMCPDEIAMVGDYVEMYSSTIQHTPQNQERWLRESARAMLRAHLVHERFIQMITDGHEYDIFESQPTLDVMTNSDRMTTEQRVEAKESFCNLMDLNRRYRELYLLGSARADDPQLATLVQQTNTTKRWDWRMQMKAWCCKIEDVRAAYARFFVTASPAQFFQLQDIFDYLLQYDLSIAEEIALKESVLAAHRPSPRELIPVLEKLDWAIDDPRLSLSEREELAGLYGKIVDSYLHRPEKPTLPVIPPELDDVIRPLEVAIHPSIRFQSRGEPTPHPLFAEERVQLETLIEKIAQQYQTLYRESQIPAQTIPPVIARVVNPLLRALRHSDIAEDEARELADICKRIISQFPQE